MKTIKLNLALYFLIGVIVIIFIYTVYLNTYGLKELTENQYATLTEYLNVDEKDIILKDTDTKDNRTKDFSVKELLNPDPTNIYEVRVDKKVYNVTFENYGKEIDKVIES
ncbi:hypothetical protein ACQRXC_29350 (plasmid) [Niallia taxi]|uniref:hypothetical protein n=1 Tax=Niallia taxi TaxID=2499688 RepID=UPI003F5D6024